MSRPARSWSAMTVAWASRNCSRNRTSRSAVSSGRPHSPWSYQRGRGHDPVTVAGSIRSRVAVSMTVTPPRSMDGFDSGAAGFDFVGARAPGEADQVLVELEPDAVEAVDAGRGDEALVAAPGELERAGEAAAV